ncbi:MAG: response regulator [Lewinellaceae bacterium]|nr:response regulator [Lewinellaceae bacterium]
MKGVLFSGTRKVCFQFIFVWFLISAGTNSKLFAQDTTASRAAETIWPSIEARLEQNGEDTSRYFILQQSRSHCGADYHCLYGAYFDIMARLERRFNLPLAIYVADEMARLARRQGDLEGLADACNNLGRFHGALGNVRLTIVNLDEALGLYERLGDQPAVIRTKMSLLEHSLSYRKVQDVLPEMEALLGQAIANKDTFSVNRLKLRLMLQAQKAGFYDKMAEYVAAIEQAPLSNPLKPEEYGIAIYAALGRADLFMAENKPVEAAQYYQKALRLCQAEPSRWLEIHVLQALAKLEWGRGAARLAKAYLDTAQIKAENLALYDLLSKNFEQKAQIAEAEGRYADALEYTKKKYFYDGEFTARSAGFDLQKYNLQLEKEQLAAEKRNQELELNLKRVELRTSRIIIVSVFLLAAGLLIGLYQRWKGMRKLARQNALIQQQSMELRSLDAAKSRFFANVSHELRTPLTLMLGPVRTLLKDNKLSEKQSRLLRMASQSGQQLQQLADEILDLRKLEMGKMGLDEQPTALASFFRNYFAQFESLAYRRQVDYAYEIQVDEKEVAPIDRKKNRQVIYNLLSNAFKFTPAGGRVTVRLSMDEGRLRLEVADTGSGIHPDDLPHVFDRFFQSNRPDKAAEGGTGIGLALCQEYTRLFGGEIDVKSAPGEGAVFSVSFPARSAGDAGERPTVDSIQPATEEGEEHVLTPDLEQTTEDVLPGASGQGRPTILVVEDDPGLQDYIRLILSEKYDVVTAENGQAALDWLRSSAGCQLILSDLMMPIMDGYQLLEKLKSDDATRHIPVVMLTARAEARDKLKALRLGVDDYLLKPFDEEELLARAANLLRNHAARLREPPAGPGTVSDTITGEDRDWLEAFEAYVREHLSDDTLSVPVLAESFAMSESSLLRQLKRLTGLSPVQYLHEMRFDEARLLLENRTYNSIAKVAYEVGYADARSFSRSFKKRFGKRPSDLLGE